MWVRAFFGSKIRAAHSCGGERTGFLCVSTLKTHLFFLPDVVVASSFSAGNKRKEFKEAPDLFSRKIVS